MKKFLGKYKTNAGPDYPDNRDWVFRAPLLRLKSEVPVPDNLCIRDQGREGACTGFAVAAAIDLLKRNNESANFSASARMLYEMAKYHDEWAGEDYEGSSLRGAIYGWKQMGVCEDDDWKYYQSKKKRGMLTIPRAKAARNNTIGAHYRLRPVISDFHAALSQTGVIVVSARVHQGWDGPKNGAIKYYKRDQGGHAFAIVGYNRKGFWVQNSWGKNWGINGVALWTYDDWIENMMDAWVFRMSLPTPQIFGRHPKSSKLVSASTDSGIDVSSKARILRQEIAGHFVHIDDGGFHEHGKYWSTEADIEQTAKLVAESKDYKHFLIYGHGGLNSPDDSAVRISAMKDVFKENGIYPFHIMYDTGIMEELKDMIFGRAEKASMRTGGLSDWLDKMVEHLVRKPGTRLWNEMKMDAFEAFDANGAGTISINHFIKKLRGVSASQKKKIHLIGHSTGAVLFAHLLHALQRKDITLDTVSLLAPACSLDLYHSHYLPVLRGKKNLKIKNMDIYNLRDGLEQDDSVGSKMVYRKSLLYLVSNAFEQRKNMPILGMEAFVKDVETTRIGPEFKYSNGSTGTQTRSTTHGGFDNDIYTMNTILRNILGGTPNRPFTEQDLDY